MLGCNRIKHMESEPVPKIYLTEQMQNYVQLQIKSGTYASLSEVVHAGIRLLMEKDGARQFYALRANLEQATVEAEAGAFAPFDARAFEPDAFIESR